MEQAILPKREANLEFLDDSHPKYKTEKPYYSNVPFTKTDAPNTNVVSKQCCVPLHNIRGYEALFNLDVHGFQLIKNPSTFDQWQDGHKVVQDVYPEITELLKSQLGGDVRVIVFDHTVGALMTTNEAEPLTHFQLRRSNILDGSTDAPQGENFAPPSRVAHVGKLEASCG